MCKILSAGLAIALSATFSISIEPSYANVMSMRELAGNRICWGQYRQGGESNYGTGGNYSYSWPSGKTDTGHWTVAPDGTVTVTFENGFKRHDKFNQVGGEIYNLLHSNANTGYLNC